MAKKNSVEFALFAPYNENVSLTGDWNNWQPIPMERDQQGWWRVDVPLEDGTYNYKFKLKSNSYFSENEMVSVADPLALRVTRDADENARITVKNGQRIITTYQWQYDKTPLPTNDQLIIYEMHIGDFTGGTGDQAGSSGGFLNVIDKLDHLVDLGINAVEFMPVNDFPGGYSWGYNPRFMFAVENTYGTPDDFCRLVDECHKRGIRVILDGVYNHSEDNTPLAKIDYQYWYYRVNPDEPNVQWGPKFNYGYRDEKLNVWPARQFVSDALHHWVKHFHIDGIRFDATAIIKNYDVLYWLKDNAYQPIKNMKPFFSIAEHVPQDPAVTGFDGPMDAAWYESFSKQMQCTLVGKDQDGRQPYNVDAIAHVLNPTNEGFSSHVNVILYLDNHDQDRIMWQIGAKGGLFDQAAFRRMKLGAVLLLTTPGIPMLWMGQEFGFAAPKDVNKPQKLDWSLLNNHTNADLLAFYQNLIKMRKENPALMTGSIEPFFMDHERAILAYKRWNDEGNLVVVVANFKPDYAGEVHIPNWPNDGRWHEWVYNYDVDIQGGTLHDSLAESDVKLFIKQP
ncbi:MAG TPA: alpha-amylase family glycosyl hydrolase [Aggregatilineaceae bacterium]|nr:alpha-amylase family glycosyl hydrolase [Aggregatilineaceae bacterium]